MQSFRTEIENPVVERDIIELEKKIRKFREGSIDEESFRSLRLARGIYGQRQQGVQMVRIKLPLGIIRPEQLERLADISDRYSNGNLHITTRQDIQVHYVSLDDTPQLWSELEKDEITIREACGNTVRNVTASPFAGIDPGEPFDVTETGWKFFSYFLRNPIGQELGRKFKISLSSSLLDDARAYIHDFGLIPVVQNKEKGFKVLIGGGLGAQPQSAIVLREFVPEEEILTFAQAALKIFDQFGERNKRNKARFKYLINELGADEVIHKIENEVRRSGQVTASGEWKEELQNVKLLPQLQITDEAFERWKQLNVYRQKQKGYLAVQLSIGNGNLSSSQARELAELIRTHSAASARTTIEQNLLIRFVPEQNLEHLYLNLKELGLAQFGAGSIRDITACPGTETCNLGITGTYLLAQKLDELLQNEFEDIILNEAISIKMSGCMNSCGQHAVADIGFHGSTLRQDGATFPALQLLLGGKNKGNGEAQLADKVIKVPTKRAEFVIRILLNDFKQNKFEKESFNEFYNRLGKIYFYELLKPVADLSSYREDELMDWGTEEKFQPEIGVGECAGVKIDLVKTLLYEAYEKIEEAQYFLDQQKYRDALYTAWSSVIQSAKAFLVKNGDATNSKHQISQAFEAYYPLIASRFLEDSFDGFLKTYDFADPDEKSTRKLIQQAEQFQLTIDELNNTIKK